MSLPAMRRIVTGHNEQGQAVIVSEDAATKYYSLRRCPRHSVL